MRLILMMALMLVAIPVMADQVTTAEAMMVPQFFQDDQGYKGCGVRVIIVSTKGNVVDGGEFSLIVVTRPGIGAMFKAGGMKCSTGCDDLKALKYVHGTNYRLSSVNDGIPLKLLKPMPAEDPAFTMHIADAVEALDFLMKVVTGERMQFAYTPDISGARQAYAFTAVPMSPDEKTSFDACLAGALKH